MPTIIPTKKNSSSHLPATKLNLNIQPRISENNKQNELNKLSEINEIHQSKQRALKLKKTKLLYSSLLDEEILDEETLENETRSNAELANEGLQAQAFLADVSQAQLTQAALMKSAENELQIAYEQNKYEQDNTDEIHHAAADNNDLKLQPINLDSQTTSDTSINSWPTSTVPKQSNANLWLIGGGLLLLGGAAAAAAAGGKGGSRPNSPDTSPSKKISIYDKPIQLVYLENDVRTSKWRFQEFKEYSEQFKRTGKEHVYLHMHFSKIRKALLNQGELFGKLEHYPKEYLKQFKINFDNKLKFFNQELDKYDDKNLDVRKKIRVERNEFIIKSYEELIPKMEEFIAKEVEKVEKRLQDSSSTAKTEIKTEIKKETENKKEVEKSSSEKTNFISLKKELNSDELKSKPINESNKVFEVSNLEASNHNMPNNLDNTNIHLDNALNLF